jgi:hypothetical protein
MTTKVFISYRRNDSRWQARMIRAAFCKAISSDNVFMDVDSIRLASISAKTFKDPVDQCEVLLAPHAGVGGAGSKRAAQS